MHPSRGKKGRDAPCALTFPASFYLFPNKILRWRRIAKICYLTGIQTIIALQPYSDPNTHQKNFVIYPQTGQYANHRQKSGVPAQKQGSVFSHPSHNIFPSQKEVLRCLSSRSLYAKYVYMSPTASENIGTHHSPANP